MSVFILLVFIGSLAIVGLFIWLMSIFFIQEPKYYDDTIFHNFMPQYSDGFHTGVILRTKNIGNRVAVYFLPKDVNRGRFYSITNKKIIEQKVYFDKKNIMTFPKGTLSSERNIVWGLPPKTSDLPEVFKSSAFGVALMKMIEDNNTMLNEVSILENKNKRQHEFINKYTGLEIADNIINLYTEALEDSKKIFSKSEQKTLLNQNRES